jgi:septal ring factor EnvC (AmiA/AmiB activator)
VSADADRIAFTCPECGRTYGKTGRTKLGMATCCEEQSVRLIAEMSSKLVERDEWTRRLVEERVAAEAKLAAERAAHEHTKAELAEAHHVLSDEIDAIPTAGERGPLSLVARIRLLIADAKAGTAGEMLNRVIDERNAAQAKLASVEADAAESEKEGEHALRQLDKALTERDALAARVPLLEAMVRKVGELLAENGCDCECDHHPDEHDAECERCLGCRISAALDEKGGAK